MSVGRSVGRSVGWLVICVIAGLLAWYAKVSCQRQDTLCFNVKDDAKKVNGNVVVDRLNKL